jgi:hypothetical protein
LSLAIPVTASLTNVAATGTSLSALQASDFRVEELLDAILVRGAGEAIADVDTAGNAGNTVTFLGNQATVQFSAVNQAIYRLRIRDIDGISLTTMSDGTAGLADDEEDTVINVGTTGPANTIGATFVDFRAAVGAGTASNTATITLNRVTAGFTASIVRLNDFGDEVATSAVTITLRDNFEPHVAIQNSTDNGQDTQMTQGTAGLVEHATSGTLNAPDSGDTSEMLFSCGIERSDDNGEAEVGDRAYFFPKLNLSASLYDNFDLRAHTEATGLLSTAMNQGQAVFAGSAEDGALSTASLAVSAFNSPLLATISATESAEGTTASGRSDNFYTAADYDAWGRQRTTAAGPICQYYAAEISNVTGLFTGNWYPSDVTGGVAAGAIATLDNDSSQDTVPSALSEYAVTSTYNQVLLDRTTATGNILRGPANCGVPGTNVYDFDRTVVLNMTEAVTAPADLTAFAAQTGVCNQTNIPAGELSAATGLTAITGPTTGWNNDHLLLEFDDWRTIDDSNHFTSITQTQVANQLSEGSSLTDLLQIVSLTDANGVAATAGNARGVHIVDATPPMATRLTLNADNSLTIAFDQAILLSDTGGVEFTLTGFDEVADTAVNYNFNITSATVGTVTRSTAYTGPYGNIIGAADGTLNNNAAIARITLSADGAQPNYALGVGDPDESPIAIAIVAAANADVNVPAAVPNSQITVSIDDAVVDTINVDLGSFFNPLQHTSAASVAATAGTTPSFAINYDGLQDANFNSWAEVERADAYDGVDGAVLGGAAGPRLVGADTQGPKIQTSAVSKPLNVGYDAVTAANDDVDRMFLYADSANGIAVTSIHATEVTDTDSIYTPDTVAPFAVGASLDVSLAHVWGWASGVIAANNPTANSTLAVIKLNVNDVDIDSAIAYIYQPINGERVDGGTVFANTNTIIGTGGMNAAGIATSFSSAGVGAVGEVGLRNNDANNNSLDTLVVELPNLTGTPGVSQGDVLVIQNLLVDGIYYSIHIPAPAAVADATTVTPVVEGDLPASGANVFKLVQLQNTDSVGELRTGNEYGNTTNNYRDAGALNFNEALSAATAIDWNLGTDDSSATINAGAAGSTNVDEVVIFTAAATVNALQAEELDYTLDAVDSGSVTETALRVVGNNAALNVTATDVAGNASRLVLTFRKGHGIVTFNSGQAGNADGEDVILNTISGSAID